MFLNDKLVARATEIREPDKRRTVSCPGSRKQGRGFAKRTKYANEQ